MVLDLFFSKFSSFCSGFKGESKTFNLLNYDLISELEKVDVCFMFKVTNIIDQGKGHKISEKVITAIPAKFVITAGLICFPKLVPIICDVTTVEVTFVDWETEAAEHDIDVLDTDDVGDVTGSVISFSFIGVPVFPPTITLVVTVPGCDWGMAVNVKVPKIVILYLETCILS